MIDGLSLHQVQRYLTLRERCDDELKTIQSLSTMLALLDACPDATLRIDPVALAHTQSMILTSTLNVLEALEAFVALAEAKQVERDAY